MEDIEQIEVVRGPGAVMWGPNAVNGVINVITRRAKATKGGQVSVATGNEVRNSTEARWGAAPSDAVAYRVWGKFDYRTPAFDSPGYFRFNNRYNYRDPDIRNLDAGAARVGFRLEGQSGEKDQWMVQAEGYQMDRQDPLAYPVIVPTVIARSQGHTDYEGGDVQAKWTHTASVGNESELQFTYSRNDLNYPFLAGQVNNLTLDYQHRSQAGEHNELYWGAGYQQYWDRTQTGTGMAFSPLNYTFRSGDVVVRDEWQFVPGRWMVSAGVRIDYNSYHRVEYQPSFRLLYTPTSKQSAWVGVSRAVRVPSRFDRDVEVNYGLFDTGVALASVSLTGDRAFRSEVERSLEAGYRVQSGQRWSVDTSVFWSYYGRLRLLDTPAIPTTILPGPVPIVPMNFTIDNSGAGRSFGGEVWGSFQVNERWRLTPSYSYLNETRWAPSNGYFAYVWDGTPAELPHQAIVRSQHDLSRQLKFDLMMRAHSRDTTLNLPAAVLLDARLAWRPTRSGELSLTVNDLTNREVLDCCEPEKQTRLAVGHTVTLPDAVPGDAGHRGFRRRTEIGHRLAICSILQTDAGSGWQHHLGSPGTPLVREGLEAESGREIHRRPCGESSRCEAGPAMLPDRLPGNGQERGNPAHPAECATAPRTDHGGIGPFPGFGRSRQSVHCRWTYRL
jgi:iron complex outermembrane receptor protein